MRVPAHYRTSQTDPLRIDAIALPTGDGLIGLTLCPGKKQTDGHSGAWWRDLDTDLAAIQAWGVTVVVTLIEAHEFEWLQVTALPERVRAHGMRWYHLPIVDGNPPGTAFERTWETVGKDLRQRLLNGERIVVHCMGGLGRAGTIAARLLVEFGETPDSAIKRVRTIRPGAIETEPQEAYVRQLKHL